MSKLFELREIREELERAEARFAPFHSPHEGYAVILEEVRELEREVFTNGGGRSEAARTEALQIATMALRYMRDLCEQEQKP